MAIAIEHSRPCISCIHRHIDATTFTVLSFVPRPRREIESIRCAGISCQAVRSVASLRHRYSAPVFRSIRGLVNRAIALCPYAPILRTTCHQHVECPSAIPDNSPGKRFFLRDASVFQLPVLAPVHALVYTAPEGGYV